MVSPGHHGLTICPYNEVTYVCMTQVMRQGWLKTGKPISIPNSIPSKVWDEISYSFLSFNGYTIEVCEWISNFVEYFSLSVISYPCSNLIYISKWVQCYISIIYIYYICIYLYICISFTVELSILYIYGTNFVIICPTYCPGSSGYLMLD